VTQTDIFNATIYRGVINIVFMFGNKLKSIIEAWWHRIM